jgi:hypothetical protein
VHGSACTACHRQTLAAQPRWRTRYDASVMYFAAESARDAGARLPTGRVPMAPWVAARLGWQPHLHTTNQKRRRKRLDFLNIIDLTFWLWTLDLTWSSLGALGYWPARCTGARLTTAHRSRVPCVDYLLRPTRTRARQHRPYAAHAAHFR